MAKLPFVSWDSAQTINRQLRKLREPPLLCDMPKRRTPNYKKAAAAIEELGEKPKEKRASPLEIFVSDNYDRVIKAIENGYSLSEICVTLRQQNISALPKQLRSALYEQALKQGSVDQLPASLQPQLPEQPALRTKTEAI